MKEKYQKQWDKECKLFKGDNALFWAGKMSIVIQMLYEANISRFSVIFELLLYCQTRYDNIIFNRV